MAPTRKQIRQKLLELYPDPAELQALGGKAVRRAVSSSLGLGEKGLEEFKDMFSSVCAELMSGEALFHPFFALFPVSSAEAQASSSVASVWHIARGPAGGRVVVWSFFGAIF